MQENTDRGKQYPTDHDKVIRSDMYVRRLCGCRRNFKDPLKNDFEVITESRTYENENIKNIL